jgi:hypothetical protein
MALTNFEEAPTNLIPIINICDAFPFLSILSQPHHCFSSFLALFIRDFIVVGACEADIYQCNRTFVMRYFVQNMLGLTVRKTDPDTGPSMCLCSLLAYPIWRRCDVTHREFRGILDDREWCIPCQFDSQGKATGYRRSEIRYLLSDFLGFP